MTKIIHTSDWHLGQKLHNQDRTAEHQAFLTWLLELMADEDVSGLLVCGDIFDAANPPVSAVKLLTEFIVEAIPLCPNIAFIAGNHDSAGRLDALKPLLTALGVISIGAFPDQISDCIFPFKDRSGKDFARVACLPYLRPMDLAFAPPGESSDQTTSRIISSVSHIYRQATEALVRQKTDHEALIVTGHLSVHGGKSTEGERPIQTESGRFMGIPASAFDERIDYVALGHLHRSQNIHGGAIPISYAGSPIPLSFGEANYTHDVRMISLKKNGGIANIESKIVPRTMDMLDITGTFTELHDHLSSLVSKYPATGSSGAMVRVNVELDSPMPSLKDEIMDIAAESNLTIMAIRRIETPSDPVLLSDNHQELDEFNPTDIFRLKYQESYQSAPPKELERAFQEILEEVYSGQGLTWVEGEGAKITE